jgi:hypothetical protein
MKVKSLVIVHLSISTYIIFSHLTSIIISPYVYLSSTLLIFEWLKFIQFLVQILVLVILAKWQLSSNFFHTLAVLIVWFCCLRGIRVLFSIALLLNIFAEISWIETLTKIKWIIFQENRVFLNDHLNRRL